MSEYKYLSPAHLICFGLCQFYSIAAFESTLRNFYEPSFWVTHWPSIKGGWVLDHQSIRP